MRRVSAWNVARDVERGAGTWSQSVIKIDAGGWLTRFAPSLPKGGYRHSGPRRSSIRPTKGRCTGAPLICHSSASQALTVSPASAKAAGASGRLWPASIRRCSWRPMNISA